MARPLGPVIRIDPRSRGDVRRRRRVSRRQYRRGIRRRFLALTLFCIGVFAAAALVVPSINRTGDVPSSPPSSVASAPADAALTRVAVRTPIKRPRYGYSVIPGGVASAQELSAAVAADPVVAQHYETFDAAAATLVKLDRTRFAYVSYRLGNRVFWTRHRVRLPAGEPVLTDGRTVVRTRCGNRISDVPGETSPDEPDPILIDTPVDDPAVPAVSTPVLQALLLSAPIVIDPSGSGDPSSSGEPVLLSHTPAASGAETPSENPPRTEFPPLAPPPPPRLRSVPEPNTVMLLAAGVFGLLRARRRRNRMQA